MGILRAHMGAIGCIGLGARAYDQVYNVVNVHVHEMHFSTIAFPSLPPSLLPGPKALWLIPVKPRIPDPVPPSKLTIPSALQTV